jgi:biotin transport system substrate-specific component
MIETTQPGIQTESSAVHPFVKQAAFAIAGTALVALCAHISLPLGFTPVPLTLQPFAVVFLGLLMSPVTAFACLALYLAEGAAGMPVFSPHGPGGTLQLFGPTGGYLMAAPVAAAVASLLSRSVRRFSQSFLVLLASAAVGDAILLCTGAAWLGMHTHTSMHTTVERLHCDSCQSRVVERMYPL